MNKILDAQNQRLYRDNFYSRIEKNSSNFGATKAALRKLLRSIDTVGWSHREESGRLDRRAFSRYAIGDASVFSRREHKEAERSAVSILVDISGSTFTDCGPEFRIDVFASVTACLSKLLDECGVNTKISAFYGKSYGHTDEVNLLDLKGYGDSLRSRAAEIGAIPALVRGSTPDYGAVYEEIIEISRRKEKRKVLFLVTDADDFDKGNANHLQRLADGLGVTIIAICIGGDISKCYTHYVNAKSAAEVFGGAFGKLLHSIKVKQ